MPKYVVWGSYCNDVLEKRGPHRQAHLDRLTALKAEGRLVTLGPTQDLSLFFGVYEAADAAIAQQLVEDDPYWQHGIWTDYQIKEWIQAF
jgi:uncharacterized protein